MKSTVLVDPSVAAYLSEQYRLFVFDYDLETSKAFYRYFKGSDDGGVPYFVIIDENGKRIKELPGAVKVNRFKEFIELPGIPVEKVKSDENPQAKESLVRRFMWWCYLSRVKPGIKAGYSYTTFHASPSGFAPDYRSGYHAGLTAFTHLSNKFQCEAALQFHSMGAKNNRESVTYRLNYLELPVTFSVDLFRSFFCNYLRLNLSPFVSMAVEGKEKRDGSSRSLRFGNASTDDFKCWDYGLRPAVDLALGTFELNVGYSLGLHNISNDPQVKLYNRGFFTTVALIFGN